MSKIDHLIFKEYDWDTFQKANLEMFCTEFFSEDYPLLGEYIDEYGLNKDLLLKFIEKAINIEGKTYQNCLDDIICFTLDGARYSHEVIYYIVDSIQYLLQKGAIFSEEKIFLPRYKSINSNNNIKPTYEDEIYDYHVRGKLLDEFHYKMNLTKYIDWSQIPAKYWEDYKTNEITDEKRFSYLKYCSKYLCSTYPNVNDFKGYDDENVSSNDSNL
jgi:hypothetical protein